MALDFEIWAPASRIRRLRAHLNAQIAAGGVAREAGEAGVAPPDLMHQADVNAWLSGYNRAEAVAERASEEPPTARQIEGTFVGEVALEECRRPEAFLLGAS